MEDEVKLYIVNIYNEYTVHMTYKHVSNDGGLVLGFVGSMCGYILQNII